MLPAFVRKYLIAALAGTPDVLDGFLREIPDDDPRWDFRPDPERFTLREVIAHLADWEPIFLERMTRIQRDEEPFLISIDEGQVALDHDYAGQSPQDNLLRFRKGRSQMVAFLRSVLPPDWERQGRYFMDPSEEGELISLEGWLAEVAGHDGYHTQQVALWLAAGKE